MHREIEKMKEVISSLGVTLRQIESKITSVESDETQKNELIKQTKSLNTAIAEALDHLKMQYAYARVREKSDSLKAISSNKEDQIVIKFLMTKVEALGSEADKILTRLTAA